MADITMCNDQMCPRRLECHRYTAVPTPQWQSQFSDSPRVPGSQACEQFWSNEGRRKHQRFNTGTRSSGAH